MMILQKETNTILLYKVLICQNGFLRTEHGLHISRMFYIIVYILDHSWLVLECYISHVRNDCNIYCRT